MDVFQLSTAGCCLGVRKGTSPNGCVSLCVLCIFSLIHLFSFLSSLSITNPSSSSNQEGGRSKSHRYWPKLGSKHNSATHGKFKVTTKFRTDSGCYATTGLKVKHLLSGQERTVWHLQYTDWPEQGCPEYVQGFLCEWQYSSFMIWIVWKFVKIFYSLFCWEWDKKIKITLMSVNSKHAAKIRQRYVRGPRYQM